MKVIHTIKDLQAELTALRAQGKKVGLLFDGMFGLHIQLLRHLVAVVGKKIIV